MKKGDLVGRDNEVKGGESLAHAFTTVELAEEWARRNSGYPTEITQDPFNKDCYMVVAKDTVYIYEEAKVNWVVGDEVAIEYSDGGCKIFNSKEETGWRVVKEASPTYQSTVEHMSDNELREAIDGLRRTRVSAPRPLRGSKVRTPLSKDPVAQALSQMTPEKKKELMKKLGMVD